MLSVFLILTILMVAYCGFKFIFPDDCDIIHFVYVLIGHFVSSSVECQVKSCVHFLNGWCVFSLFVHRSFLYILGTIFLSDDMYIANIFSQSMTCLFLFSRVSLDKQKFLILMKSNLPSFSFIIHAFCVLYSKLLPAPNLQRHTPVFF